MPDRELEQLRGALDVTEEGAGRVASGIERMSRHAKEVVLVLSSSATPALGRET